MAEFKFKNGKKTLEIEGKSYEIDVGNYETMQSWLAQIEEITKVMENDGKVIDNLLSMEKQIVDMILGDWDRLWELCNHNVYSMLDLVRHLSEFLQNEIKERQAGYGL